MQHLRFWGRLLVLSAVCLAPLAAHAYALVTVTLSSLRPNPVFITVGDAVFWTEGDGWGPYGIYGLDGWYTETDSYGIQFNRAGTYDYYDDNGDYGTIYVSNSTPNQPPSVTITAPANHAVFSAPASFAFTATASDPDADGISDVEFYVGANLVDDVFSPPYSTLVANLPAGTYTLSAVAYDTYGAAATNALTITVGTVATTNYLLPVACANIYSSGVVNSGSYLSTASNIRGGLEFAAVDPIYSSVLLALNPYGLPMGDFNVQIYGFDGGTGTLYSSNWYSGTLLGTIVFPANVTYGQVATLDVTRFVQSAKGPYFGFIIQAPGGDMFSSLAHNYGTPPELMATLSTQPPTLMASGLGNQVVISWNTNQAAGLTLQSTTNLLSPTSWVPVTTSPVQVGSRLVVTNPMAGPRQFFRLSQ
jgi:hypothetical protein